MIKKITQSSWLYALLFMLWFPVTTLFQDLISPINKALFAVVFVFMAMSMISCKIIRDKRTIALIAVSIVVYLKALSYGLPENINMLFYFPFFVLYSLYILEYRSQVTNFIKKNGHYLILIIATWTVFVIASAFLQTSYYHAWGDGLYFYSFTSNSFRLCPTALFIMTMVLVLTVITRRKAYLMFDIMPMYCFLMGGSRTYLVLGVLLLGINLYLMAHNKKHFYYLLIPASFLLLFAISRTSIMDKIVYTLSFSSEEISSTIRGGILGQFTSERNVIWSKMLTAYSEGTLIEKLFGAGLSFTVNVSGLWAHNDFIEILCGHGMVGVAIYVLLMVWMIKAFLFPIGLKHNKIPALWTITVILIWLFNACFNMYYTYFCAMASYSLLLMGVYQYYYCLATVVITNNLPVQSETVPAT